MYKSMISFFVCVVTLAAQRSTCSSQSEFPPPNGASAEDVAGIQQTLSLFSVAIDLKRFDLLDDVFAPNATANFTGNSVSVGVPAIKQYLIEGLTSLVTQHDLGSLYVNTTAPGKATSLNWLQGTFFGTGDAANQTLSFFGYYKDDLCKMNSRWMVENRILGTFGRYGDERLIETLLNG